MSEDLPQKSVAEVLFSRKISRDERSRIAKLAKSDESFLSRVIRTYASESSRFDEFRIGERLPGSYPPGKKSTNTELAKRILTRISNEDTHSIFWDIYRDCVMSFLEKERLNLANAMAAATVQASEETPEGIVKALCNAAVESEIPEDQLREAYDLCWARVNDFEAILSSAKKPNEARTIKKQIEKTAETIGQQKEKLDSIEQKLAATEKVAEATRKKVDELAEHNKENLSNIEKKLTQLQKSSGENSAEFARKSEVDASLRRLATEIDKAQKLINEKSSLQQTSASIKKATDTLRDELKKSIEVIGTSLGEVNLRLASQRTEIEERLASSLKGVQTHQAHFSETQFHHSGQSPTNYRSPLICTPTTEAIHGKISTASEFARVWVGTYSPILGAPHSWEQALTYLSIFAANNVIVLSDYALLETWIERLGWKSRTMHLAASPLWTNEADWAAGAAHVFADEAKPTPRILVIHGYDAGLVEAYLLPTLALWALQPKRNPLAKIFLIASDGTAAPRADVMIHAGVVQVRDFAHERDFRLNADIRVPNSFHVTDADKGVDPIKLLEWGAEGNVPEIPFVQLQKSLSIALPLQIEAKVKKLAGVLMKYFPEDLATYIAMYHQAAPWVSARLGEARANDLLEYLRTIASGGVRY